MPRYLVIRYDVSHLTNDERIALAMEAIVQGEPSDDHDNAPAVEVCRFCGHPEDDGSPEVRDHCSGGGGRACRERQAVEDFSRAIDGMCREDIAFIDVRRWVVRQYDVSAEEDHVAVQLSLERAIREYHDIPFDGAKTPHARRA